MNRSLLAFAVLALAAAPAAAQNHEHAAAQAGQEMGPSAMICSMGMLPHAGMGGMGGPGMGGMMKSGAGMMGGMKQGQAQGMQHGQMQHGNTTGSDKPAATAMKHEGGMEHPVTPTMLLHHAKDLELTQDQVAKVTQLATTSQAACETHLKAATEAHHAAAALLGDAAANPDVAQYETRLREAVTHVLQAHVGVVKAGVEAKAVLTPAQVEKLKASAKMEHK